MKIKDEATHKSSRNVNVESVLCDGCEKRVAYLDKKEGGNHDDET